MTVMLASPRRISGRPGCSVAGLTLTELVLSCAVLGLLTIAGVQGLQGILPAVRVDRAARDVCALLEWARWSAVREGRPCRVAVEPVRGLLTVYLDDGDLAEGRSEREVRRLDLRRAYPGIVFGAAEGVQRTSGCRPVRASGVHLADDTVRFMPSGRPDRCGALYLVPARDLPDRKDRMYAVTILLATGRLRIWRYEPFGPSECEGQGTWRPL